MVDFVKTTDFDNRLENLNKNVTSNKHVEVEKKLTDLTKNAVQISDKGYNFLSGRIYFTGNDVVRFF